MADSLEASEATSSYVYFIQEGKDGPVKIGTTSGNPHHRLRNMQTGNSSNLRLLAAVVGGGKLEHELHRRFDHVRIRGEWFRPAADLMAFLDGVRLTHEVPQDDGLDWPVPRETAEWLVGFVRASLYESIWNINHRVCSEEVPSMAKAEDMRTAYYILSKLNSAIIGTTAHSSSQAAFFDAHPELDLPDFEVPQRGSERGLVIVNAHGNELKEVPNPDRIINVNHETTWPMCGEDAEWLRGFTFMSNACDEVKRIHESGEPPDRARGLLRDAEHRVTTTGTVAFFAGAMCALAYRGPYHVYEKWFSSVSGEPNIEPDIDLSVIADALDSILLGHVVGSDGGS